MKTVLSGKEKARLLALFIAIAAATLAAVGASVLIGRSYVFLAGLGILAYVFGLRHALDADHIAAIDNTTRKLMHEGKRPFTVGTWFSLGHSTIVILLIVILVFATRAVSGSIPSLQAAGAILGTAISGLFLWVIGAINLAIVAQIYYLFKGLRSGKIKEANLDELLNKRGFMSRYLGRFFSMVSEPWQIYPVGILFGLGFDTASEVALIAISVGAGASSSVPLWMTLVLPLMFTCGMVLVDTIDGVVMTLAYGWAFLKPIRKVYYNLTITLISIAVALLIGTIEVMQVVSSELHLGGGFWGWLSGLNFESMGIGIVALFILSWIVAIAVYKFKGFDKEGEV